MKKPTKRLRHRRQGITGGPQECLTNLGVLIWDARHKKGYTSRMGLATAMKDCGWPVSHKAVRCYELGLIQRADPAILKRFAAFLELRFEDLILAHGRDSKDVLPSDPPANSRPPATPKSESPSPSP